jgi:hypothetical protein
MFTSSRLLHGPLLATALTVVAGCAGMQAPGSGPAADAPVYRVGDRWVYHAEDGFRLKTEWEETHEVTMVGADGITIRVTQKGPSIDVVRTEQWSAPGEMKVGSLYHSETRRFVSPLEVYRFPLAAGKVWNQWVDNYNEQTRVSGSINHYVRVLGWEKVATPAGTFDAIAMDVLMRLDDEEFWREPTTCNYEVWYAPAVRGNVREVKRAQYFEKGGDTDARSPIRTLNAVLELVSFSPGPP